MLLDSNIVIYAAEPKYDSVRNFIEQQSPVVSVISKIEVLGYNKLTAENQNSGDIIPISLCCIRTFRDS